ncbi:MAG: type II secretion system protein, partial [Oscillospiraceae bacterium]
MRKVRNNHGFTLVELLVVIAVAAVLLGGVIFGMMGYTDYTNFKRQNEYAQTLFVAAQNALTKYSENGEAEAIKKTMERYGITVKADMLSGTAKEQFKPEYEGRIYSLTVNKDGVIAGKGNT